MTVPPDAALPALPEQLAEVEWPTRAWPEAAVGGDVDSEALDQAFECLFAENPNDATGQTLALLAIHRGRLVREQYAEGHGPEDSFISWSMAKSITHALVGVLVGEGRLDPAARAAVPAWSGAGDPRGAITLEHLLRMVDGLDFLEDYIDGEVSHVIEMLFGAGKEDVAGYTEARPLAHEPGSFWSYSSGTSNVVSSIVGRTVGGGEEGMRAFMQRVLFEPLGIHSATTRFDPAGTWIGSSFAFMTARDFARFGLLYLRDGVWEGRRLLPEGWVDHARRETPASAGEYGAHWWLATDGSGVFHASGYQGQFIAISPTRDVILVRLGQSETHQRGPVFTAMKTAMESFPLLGVPGGAR